MQTDEEILYDDLTDTKEKIKALGRLLALRHDEQAQKLQDVSEAVRQVQANQTKQASWMLSVWQLIKKIIAFINAEIHKIYLDKDV